MNPELALRDLTVSLLYSRVIELLSLDRVAPFWPDLGLHIEHVDEVKEAARRSVRAQMAIKAREEDDLSVPGPTSLRIIAFLADVEQVDGAATLLKIRALIEDRLAPLDREWGWWGSWWLLIRRLLDREEHVVASYGLPLDKVAVLCEFARDWVETYDAIRRRCEAADAQPLEGWDAEAYADYRREGPDLSPFDGLSLSLRGLAFERIWDKILQLLNPAELDALERWGIADLTIHRAMPPHEALIPKEHRSLS